MHKDNPMAATSETIGAVTVLMVPGEFLDAHTVNEFKRTTTPLLQTSARIVLDMRHVRFVDSAGLGAILSCLRQLHATGGQLKLCGLLKPVRALFELVRLHRIIEIYNTQEEALKAFQA